MYWYQKWFFVFEFIKILCCTRTPLELVVIATDGNNESFTNSSCYCIHINVFTHLILSRFSITIIPLVQLKPREVL